MGKTKPIAETGLGRHELALATAAAYFGLNRGIRVNDVDVRKQESNSLN